MAKLMLVEDDNNLREIYEARLQAEGYEIVAARDGEEALVVAKAQKPDLIISDVMMPKISGFEMLDILRNTEDLKAVKVIMLTALGQSDDQQRADHLGADRYLVKSQVTLEDIVKVAHDLLQDTPANGTAAPTPAPTKPAASTTTVAAEPPAIAPAVMPVTEPPAASPVASPPSSPPPTVEVTPPAATTPIATDTEDEAVDSEAVEDTEPQSEAKESADVEAKIENFVAGATEEASSPDVPTPPAEPVATATEQAETAPEPTTPSAEDLSPEPKAESAPPVVAEPAAATPTVIPVAEPPDDDSVKPLTVIASDEDNATADDKLVTDAAERLAESAGGLPDEDKAAGSPTLIVPTTVPDEKTNLDSPDMDAKQPSEPDKSQSENVTIAHKKVIAPPEASPKRDIETLLAEEEAKEASATTTPTVTTDKSASSESKVDPRSIAL